MSNPLVVNPAFTADRHFSEEEFQPIKARLSKKECKEEDYQAAIELLFGLFEEMSQGRHLSLALLYHYLLLLIPHFDEEKFTKFCHDHLANLLSKSTDLHDGHRKLALGLAAWKLSHPRDESLGSVLQACREAMDFYVEAIAIAEEHQLEIGETNRQASFPFVKILKCTVGPGRPIKKRILEATRSWQRDPEHFFEVYESVENLAERLRLFNCNPEGEEVIKEVYQQVLAALNASTSEFKAQARFKDGKYFEQLRMKLNNPIPQPACWATQRYRMGLKAFRGAFGSLPLDDVRTFQKGTTQAFISFFQDTFFQDVEAIFLNAFPCRYDLRAMGSVAKAEVCRSSDLEYLILIDDEKHRDFFKQVAEMLEVMTVSLGETPLSTRSLNTLRMTLPMGVKKGLHVDLGGNPAQHGESLIRTPAKMAELQTGATDGPCSFENTTRKSISLKNNAGVVDESDLYKEYKSCLANILDPEDGPSLRQVKATIFMLRRLETYGEMAPPFAAQSGQVDLKAQFIEPLFHLISDVALYWNVPGNNTLDLIEELARKGLFSEKSKKLLIEAVSVIYSMRVNLHGLYGEQKDVVAYGTEMPAPGFAWINKEERLKLEKIYWLVIRPLYTALKTSMAILPYPAERSAREELEQREDILVLRSSEQGVKPTFVRQIKPLEDVFKSLDLVGLGFAEIITPPRGQKPKFFRPLIQHIALHLAQTQAPDADHKGFFKELSANQPLESLRQLYFTTLEEQNLDLQSVIQQLALVPNTAGLRLASIRSAERLQRALIDEMTDASPVPREDGIVVKVSSPYFETPRFLKSALIEKILERKKKVFTGAIKQDAKYKDSLHNVTSWGKWHFKQDPTHYFQEYAVHDLGFRLGGELTPEVELVRFDVNIPGVKPYPVTISETLGEGETLMDWNERPEALRLDPVQLTWLILLTLITRAGDGRPSNYPLGSPIDGLRKIFCVDNEHSFSQLLTGSLKWTIQFFSALFCLGETELERGVLEAFKKLNAKAILSAWIDQVIAKEELYEKLFTKEEREFLYKHKNRRCKLSFVLREGVLTTVHLQFVRLQEFVRVNLAKNPPVKITAQMLLSQLVDVRPEFDFDSYSKRVSDDYVRSLSAEKAITARLKFIAGRPSKTLTSPEADETTFANPPTFEEIEEGKYSARKAKDELNAIVFGDNFHVAEDALTVNCLGLENSRTRGDSSHRQVLRAALLQTQGKKRKILAFKHCDELNESSLLPFLHTGLQSLTIEQCSHFDLDALNAVVKTCPLLKNLRLVNCADLQPGIIGRPRINAPLLETVHIEGCQKLASLEITTFAIKKLALINNSLLQNVELKTNQVPQLELYPHPKVFTFTEQVETTVDLHRGAQAENAKAQFRLGKLLLGGSKSEHAEGMGWIKKSAAQDHAPAMFFLGFQEFIGGGTMYYRQPLESAAEKGYIAAIGALGILDSTRRGHSRFQLSFETDRVEKNLSELFHALADINLIENIGRSPLVLNLLRGLIHDAFGNFRPALEAFIRVPNVLLAEHKHDEALARLMKMGFREEVPWVGQPSDIVATINKSPLYDIRKSHLITGHRQLSLGGVYSDASFIAMNPSSFGDDPLFLAYRGETHMRRGNIPQALSDFNASLEAETLFFSYLTRGELHRSVGDYDLALQDFTQAIKKNPKIPVAWARRGEICLLLCYFSRAEHDLSKAIELDPSLAYAQMLMKVLQGIRKDGEPNATILDRLWKREKNRLFIFALRANYYLLKKNLKQAEIYLTVLLKWDPIYPFGLARRGEFYRLQGNGVYAMADFARATVGKPTNAYILSREAEIDRGAKRGEPLQGFEVALKLDPDNCFAKSRRGAILFDLGKTQEAFEELDQTLTMEPDNAFARAIRGEIHRLEGRVDNALSDFNQILSTDPDNDFVLSRRGFVFVSKRLPDNAMADFDKAMKLNERNTFAINGIGEMVRWKGIDAGALTFFDQVLALDPTNVFALGRKGSILVRVGEHDEGLRLLRKALELDPADRFALKAVAGCYRLKGWEDMAIEALTTLLKLDPTDFDSLIERISIRLSQKPYSFEFEQRLAKALADIDVALQLRPDDVRAVMCRAEAYRLNGEHALALRDLNVVLKRYSHEAPQWLSQVLRRDPLEADALITRAAVYRDLHIYQWSLDDLNAALRIRPDDRAARQARGVVFQLSGDPDAALKDLADFDTREACLACAAAYRDKKDYENALKKLDQAKKLGASGDDVNNLRGMIYRLMGNHQVALEHFNIWNKDPFYLFVGAATMAAKRDFKQCFYWLEHALPLALPHLGLMMMTQRRVPLLKKHREAIDAVDRELQKVEECEEVHLLRALIAITVGREAAALQQLSFALKISPLAVDLIILLARVNLAMGRHSATLHQLLTAELQEHYFGMSYQVLNLLVKHDALIFKFFEKNLKRHPDHAQLLQRRATFYLANGDYRAALGDLEQLLQARPAPLFARKAKAFAHYKMLEFDAAFAACDEVLRVKPGSAFALKLRGEILLSRKEFQKASDDFSAVLDQIPDDVWSLKKRGKAQQELQDLPAVVRDYDRVLQLYPNDVSMLRARADLHKKRRNFASVLEDYDRIERLNPNTYNALDVKRNRWRICLELDDHDATLRAIDEYLALRKDDEEALRAKATILFLKGKYEEALQIVAFLLTSSPQDYAALELQAKIYLATKDYNSALTALDQILVKRPWYPIHREVRGKVHFALGHYDSALNDFSADSHDLEALICLAKIHLMRRKFLEAKKIVEKGLERKPNNVEALLLRSEVSYGLGDYPEALSDLQKALDQNPAQFTAWGRKGEVEFLLGNRQQADADLTKAIELDPRNALAWSRRGAVRQQQGDQAAALADLNESVRLDARDPFPYVTLAEIALAQGGEELAVAHLGQAISLIPDSRSLRLRYEILQRRGRREAAMKDLEQLLILEPRNRFGLLQRLKYSAAQANDPLILQDLSSVWRLLLPELFAVKGQPFRPHLEGSIKSDLQELLQLLVTRPRNLAILKSLAMVHLLAGQLRESVPLFEEAVTLDAKDPESLRLRGFARSHLGDDTSALADFDRAVSIDDDSIEDIQIRAAVYPFKGDDKAVAAYLEQARLRDPTDVKIVLCQGNIDLSHQRYHEAKRSFEIALRLLPNHPTLLSLCGDICRLLGDFVGAEAFLSQALKLDPALPFALVRRADLHVMKGRTQEAKHDLEDASKEGPLDPYGRQVAAYAQRAEGVAANETELLQYLSNDSVARDYLVARAACFVEQGNYELAWLVLNQTERYYNLKEKFIAGHWMDRIKQALMQSLENPFLLKILLYLHLVMEDEESALHLLSHSQQLSEQNLEILILRVCLNLVRGHVVQVADDMASLEARFEHMILSSRSSGHMINRFNRVISGFAQHYCLQFLKEQPQSVEGLKIRFILDTLKYGYAWVTLTNTGIVELLSLRPDDRFALKLDNCIGLPRFRQFGPPQVTPHPRSFEKELNAFNRVLAGQPGDPFALKCLALIYALSHQFDLSLSTFGQLKEDSLDPFDLAIRAEAYHHKRDYRSEVQNLNALIGKFPAIFEFLERRALAQAELGDNPAAARDLDAIIAQAPKENAALIRRVLIKRCQLHRTMQRDDLALEVLDKLIENDPKDLEARELRAEIYSLKGEIKLAIADLQVVAKERPHATEIKGKIWRLMSEHSPVANKKNVLGLLQRVQLARDNQLLDFVREDIDAVLRISPSHPVALALSAMSHAEGGETYRAPEVLVRMGQIFGVADQDPPSPDVWIHIQKVLEQQQLPRQAVDKLHAIFQKSQASSEKKALTLPVVSSTQRDTPQTLEELGAAIEKRSDDRNVLLLKRAAIYVEQRQFELAWKDFYQAVASDLGNFVALFVPIHASPLGLRNTQRELQELKELLQRVPVDESDSLLAWVEFAMGNYESATEIVNRLPIQDLEESWTGLLDLLPPLIHLAKGNFDDFREFWFWPVFGQEGLAMIPAAVHKLKGEYDLAKEEVRQFLKIEPTCGWALVMRGELLSLQGEYAEALTVFDSVTEHGEYDDRHLAKRKRAESLLRQGDYDAVLEALRFKEPDVSTSHCRAMAYHLTGFHTLALFEILQAIDRASFFAIKAHLMKDALVIVQEINAAIERTPQENKLFILRALYHAFDRNYPAALEDILHTFNQLFETPANLIDEDVDRFEIEYGGEIRLWLPIDKPPAPLKERKLDRKLSDLCTLILDQLGRRLTSAPDDPQLLTICAAIHFFQRNDRAAIAHLNRALEVAPLEPFALVLRGNVRRLSGGHALALADLDLILGTDPQMIEALSLRCDVHFAFGNYAQAEADCKTVLASQPKNSLALKVLEKLQLHVFNG